MIRSMNKSDISSLSEIYYQTRLETFHWVEPLEIKPNDFSRDTNGEKIWLAERGDHVAGFISVSESDNFIHHLYVLPNFSDQGIGSELLNTCLKHIGRPAKLKCVSANTKALGFYKSKGWRSISVGVSEHEEYQLMEMK